MPSRDPMVELATHEVANQPPDFAGRNLYLTDLALREAVHREGAGWAEHDLASLGEEAGGERVLELGDLANRCPPELRAFDRFGRRVDEVRFHPAYHELMSLAVGHGIHSVAWTAGRPGGHVAHAAKGYLLAQAEAGVLCPVVMTHAVVPVLRRQPELEAWLPRVLSDRYDPRAVPAEEKAGATFGMAMTEKQGGSDLRANATRAWPIDGAGAGREYLLTGHKWFCSAPMSDAFLTLAQADGGLSCFLVPRWQPDGSRNPFLIQRLKDKLGNRSNASAEIEYNDTWAVMVGEEGRGVPTIIEMVHETRLGTTFAAAGLMRMALAQALHHTSHRTGFGRLLVRQPLMRSVLADLAIESEAATALSLRVARAFGREGEAPPFSRLAVAVAKYWLNKRCPAFVCEALECHGGAGYVEESPLPRLYREAPLNGIWEGSGNVICLDVLRTMDREPEATAALFDELDAARGADARLDRWVHRLKDLLADRAGLEVRARLLVEHLALALQASLLVRHAPTAVADAFCASRLGGDWGRCFGTLPPDTDFDAIIARALGA
ncbi:isovaleryl-CoA dehydrogenase [Arenibaculum sp.]|uniref:isovaleryl-CoA dehydrogenase n=1 Tax=Arenibaculum sp. TaxID=2865862 RepID=UPI002E159D99|nr:isovaleryl-CoA dehydrogenase [Arenibaculum sp.]